MSVICFDLDGTLLETHLDIAVSFNVALEQVGLPPIPVEIQRGFRQYTLTPFIQDAFDYLGVNNHALERRVSDAHHRHYHRYMCKNGKPFDGIIDVITQLREQGHKICVITNKPQFFADKELTYWFPDFKFDYILGSEVDGICKPNPFFILPLYEQTNCTNEDVWYIGDTISDCLFAENCCINFIGAAWGYDAGGEMQERAKTVCKIPKEILKIFS